MSPTPRSLHEALEILAPGTPLRAAFERIIQHGNGALVVLGNGPDVQELSNGGFVLESTEFSPARLAELAKMDGAIVLDDDCTQILRVNVHLTPRTEIPTVETGARHRTAERVARQTKAPVVSISEDRRMATLFMRDQRHELQMPTIVAARVNQSLQTLERFRRRLDESVERLTRYEVADLVIYRHVIDVLQRAEMVRRIGDEIAEDSVGLGYQGQLVQLQLEDLTQGVGAIRELVLQDYVRGRGRSPKRALSALEGLTASELNSADRVAGGLGFDHPEAQAEPAGYRLLSHVPRLPLGVRQAIVRKFRTVQAMLSASVENLDEVAGVGSARAAQIRRYFDRLVEAARVWESPYDA